MVPGEKSQSFEKIYNSQIKNSRKLDNYFLRQKIYEKPNNTRHTKKKQNLKKNKKFVERTHFDAANTHYITS